MAWKDIWFGVALALASEFVLVVAVLAVALLRSERSPNRLLKAAGKAREKNSDD